MFVNTDKNIELEWYIILQIDHTMASQKSLAFVCLLNLCVVLCASLPWTYKQTGERTGNLYKKVKLFLSL